MRCLLYFFASLIPAAPEKKKVCLENGPQACGLGQSAHSAGMRGAFYCTSLTLSDPAIPANITVTNFGALPWLPIHHHGSCTSRCGSSRTSWALRSPWCLSTVVLVSHRKLSAHKWETYRPFLSPTALTCLSLMRRTCHHKTQIQSSSPTSLTPAPLSQQKPCRQPYSTPRRLPAYPFSSHPIYRRFLCDAGILHTAHTTAVGSKPTLSTRPCSLFSPQ